MTESIKIKNFGPIRNVNIPDIKPFTLFIGESASGKSTILKVIALFRYIFKMNNIDSYYRNSNVQGSPFDFFIEELIDNCGFDDMITTDTEVEYSIKINENTYTLLYKEKVLLPFLILVNEDLSFFKVSFVSENRNIIPIWASKAAANKGATLGFYFHETYDDFDKATNDVKELNIDFLGLKLDVMKLENAKKYILTPQSGEYEAFELRNASSGIQTSAPLLTIVRYFSRYFSFKDAFRRSFLNYLYQGDNLKDYKPEIELADFRKFIHVHVEEPELCLYPDAQRELVNSLVSECFLKNEADRSLTLMIATHSPYIINQLNVLLRAYYFRGNEPGRIYLNPDNVVVYKVTEGTLQLLNAVDNKTNEAVINTFDLSETMNNIYSDYVGMSK